MKGESNMAKLDYPGLTRFKGKIDAKLAGTIAAEYSASATYAVGDFVIYKNNLYKCITAISTAEEWTAAHWAATTEGAEASELVNALKSGREEDAGYHLGFYLDENGDLCQVEEE